MVKVHFDHDFFLLFKSPKPLQMIFDLKITAQTMCSKSLDVTFVAFLFSAALVWLFGKLERDPLQSHCRRQIWMQLNNLSNSRQMD